MRERRRRALQRTYTEWQSQAAEEVERGSTRQRLTLQGPRQLVFERHRKGAWLRISDPSSGMCSTLRLWTSWYLTRCAPDTTARPQQFLPSTRRPCPPSAPPHVIHVPGSLPAHICRKVGSTQLSACPPHLFQPNHQPRLGPTLHHHCPLARRFSPGPQAAHYPFAHLALALFGPPGGYSRLSAPTRRHARE